MPKLLGQHGRHPGADVANRQGVQEPGQPAVLAGFDALQQVVHRFAAHPLQVQQPVLPGFEPVEIAEAADELFADQLIDQLVAQALRCPSRCGWRNSGAAP